MGKLTYLGFMAIACCASLAVAMGYGGGGAMMGGGAMYNPYMMSGMMGGMKGGASVMPYPIYSGGGGAGRGFAPVGQGGIMQFFFMLIFLMFFMQIFRGIGGGGGFGGGGKDSY